ncbi:uncharacterized protein LOC142743707 [Rhinoderma darwinii]|uniref:uncharacterized protein LOC142743707 n=1 Tax=Rhinoderma darwinii TaxID=43563 RepID=UPI003F6664AA
MAQKLFEKYFCLPTGPIDKTEKRNNGPGCCDLMRICGRRAPILDYSPDNVSVQACVRLLEEFLADGGCAPDGPRSCGCWEFSLQDARSLAVVLSPAFQVLPGHEELRLGGSLKSPFQRSRGLSLQLDVMRCWHKMATAVPWLQDLLEVCCTVVVPAPRRMCLSCRECQAGLSEVSAGKNHRTSNQQTERRKSVERRRSTTSIFQCPDQTGDQDLSGKEMRSDQRHKPGLLASIQQLKNSLKKDLETHQLYLRAIEIRLSCLDRRAQDVTKHLEKANLDLEDIKQGSVTHKTPVDEQISSPVTEDLEGPEERDLNDGPWEKWKCGVVAGSSEFCRIKNQSCARDCPADGSSGHQRNDLQSGLSTCQRHVDVLIQQITQQIHQMESDIRVTSKLRQSAG